MHKHSSQNSLQKKNKMALDIPNEVENVDTVDEEEEEVYLKKEVETALIGQLVNQLKLTGQLIPQTTTI